MHHLSTYIIGGLLGALAIDGMSGEFAARWQGWPTTSAAAVNRDLKGNRLPVAVNDARQASRSLRVAGQLDHIDGAVNLSRAVLFNPTPMMAPGAAPQRFGTWSVGLGAATPSQPTMRPDTPPRPIPTKTTPPPRLPDACDPAFSPIAAPTLAHIIGRCLT